MENRRNIYGYLIITSVEYGATYGTNFELRVTYFGKGIKFLKQKKTISYF